MSSETKGLRRFPCFSFWENIRIPRKFLWTVLLNKGGLSEPIYCSWPCFKTYVFNRIGHLINSKTVDKGRLSEHFLLLSGLCTLISDAMSPAVYLQGLVLDIVLACVAHLVVIALSSAVCFQALVLDVSAST